MILPNGSPRIIAIEVPVTTILSASERNFSDTTLTAAGDAIDQNTECVHATPIRDTINIPYEAEKADSIWKIPKSAIVPNKSLLKSILFNRSINGRDSNITIHEYTVISTPACASVI